MSSEFQAALSAATSSLRCGDLQKAESHLQRAFRIHPDDPRTLHLLGCLALQQDDPAAAETHLSRAVKAASNQPDYIGNLGVALKRLGRVDEALECFQKAHQLDRANAIHIGNVVALLYERRDIPAALQFLERAVRRGPGLAKVHAWLGAIYRDIGRSWEAIACMDRAVTLAPTDLGLRLCRAVARLPIWYESDEQRRHARQLYASELEDLEYRTETASPVALADAASSVGFITNFHLAYQGEDSVDLQRRYGKLVARFMRAFLPQFAHRPAMDWSGTGSPIRVGFVSAYLYSSHSNWKMPIRGWVENLDPQRFELYAYHLGADDPGVPEVAHHFGNRFRTCRNMPVEQVASRIRSDGLHVLIYPGIGMSGPETQLASLWLAPVQCTSWGHPDTSGLSSIDYFLSSDLMEPADADRYYSEKLIRLPKLSIAYYPPSIRRVERDRAHFGLDRDSVCFFCAQSLFKYLPAHDRIFVEIAKRVPKVQFVFCGDADSREQSMRVQRRIERALASAGITSSGKVVMMAVRLPQEEFHALARLCDVYLDSLDWSGCNSAIESMMNGLPIGTFPGRFMRGRHTYAFLKLMGLPALIAEDEASYVDLMVKLGNDVRYRERTRKQIANRLTRLYDDKQSVAGLERFLTNAVSGTVKNTSHEPRLLERLRAEIKTQLASRIQKDRPLALIDFPDSGNCGDLAIWSGEVEFLRELGVEPALRCSMQDYNRDRVANALGRNGIILLHGGGNFGDIYVYHEFRENVLREFPEHEAILFPHTAKFYSEEALRRSAEFYNARGRILLCARDQRTFELFRSRFDKCEALLVPDMAFALDPQPRLADPIDDVLFLARTDTESAYEKGATVRRNLGKAVIKADLRVDGFPGTVSLAIHRGGGISVTDWYEMQMADRTGAQAYAQLDFDSKARLQIALANLILSLGRVVVTDRLHAHVLCLLFGIPHVVVDNNYGKLGDFLRTWSAGSPLVRIAPDIESALAIARGWATACKAIEPPPRQIKALISAVRAARLTYLTEARLESIAASCEAIEAASVPGTFIETGCALGGSAIVIAKCKSRRRPLKIFDVFATIPPPSEQDGQDVQQRYRRIIDGEASGIGGDLYYGYQPELLAHVRENLARFDVVAPIDGVELIRGTFDQTLRISEPVAFAHIDCDWYASVMTCLERIVPMLSPGGVVLIDDYSDWSGCRKAVDEFFAGLENEFILNRLDSGPMQVTRRTASVAPEEAWKVMPGAARTWSHRAEEVAKFIPKGSRVLDLGCGTMALEKFLPRDSVYVPSDCVARDARTLVCDLDKDDLPKVAGVSLITTLGVVEYLTDIGMFLRRLRSYRVPAIVSFVPYDPRALSLERRKALHWNSHLTQEQWCDALSEAGFEVRILKALDRDPTQYLYHIK